MLQGSSETTATTATQRLEGFVKFPRTPHLIDTGAATDDDERLDTSQVNFFLSGGRIPLTSRHFATPGSTPQLKLIIDEKVDGGNLGLRLDPNDGYTIMVQNRSHYVNSKSHAQFKPLSGWIWRHGDQLREILAGRSVDGDEVANQGILFGEWMVAKHSVKYTALPDVFLAFDFYDQQTGRFISRSRLRKLLDGSDIKTVHEIDAGKELNRTEPAAQLTEADLLKLIQVNSEFSPEQRREGIVLRLDSDEWLEHRAKIVRNDFIAGNQHWGKQPLELNTILNNTA
ncbi:hypothetical protein GQ42DRAFT_42892 [Ramicandelaber brevisporus]|nr:hypothetical protein GQ42DRAFT_42892 [Ramicandelaber brevisporus]